MRPQERPDALLEFILAHGRREYVVLYRLGGEVRQRKREREGVRQFLLNHVGADAQRVAYLDELAVDVLVTGERLAG